MSADIKNAMITFQGIPPGAFYEMMKRAIREVMEEQEASKENRHPLVQKYGETMSTKDMMAEFKIKASVTVHKQSKSGQLPAGQLTPGGYRWNTREVEEFLHQMRS